MSKEKQTDDNINVVTIKIPPFWSSDPELWFLQVDALFVTKRITGSITKFNHVIAAISPQAAGTVRDIIRNPPEEDAYNILKIALIKRNSPTQHQRLQQLLQLSALGDQKPTELLRKMRQLNGDVEDNDLFKELFLQRLPKEIRTVLTAVGDTDSLDELANMADNMIDTSGPSDMHINQVSELKQLREEVAALRINRRYNGPVNNKKFIKPTDSLPSTLCWYHTRFGGRARSCVEPCSFKTSGNDMARY